LCAKSDTNCADKSLQTPANAGDFGGKLSQSIRKIRICTSSGEIHKLT
jgi:hypothetical protein